MIEINLNYNVCQSGGTGSNFLNLTNGKMHVLRLI